MKKKWNLILMVIGLYVIYEGYTTYTFVARSEDGSMGVSKLLWFTIPLTDYHLHTYGLIFISIGILITLASFVLYLLSLKRNKIM